MSQGVTTVIFVTRLMYRRYVFMSLIRSLNELMSDPLAIMIILVALIAAAVGLYYTIYKIKLNKALKEGRSLKTGMPSVGSATLCLWFAVWTVSTVFIIMQIQSVKNSSDEIEDKLTAIQELNNENSDMINNKLENILYYNQTKNIIFDYNFKKGKFHKEDSTIEVTVNILPKTAGKNDILRFKMGDNDIVLKKSNGGYYSGVIRLNIFDDNYGGIFTLETNGRTINECVWYENYNDTWSQYFPTTDTEMIYMGNSVKEWDKEGFKYNGKSVRINEKIRVLPIPSKADSSRIFTELALTYELDGKEIDRIDLMTSPDVIKDSDGLYWYTLEKDINFDPTKSKIDFYVKAKDNTGYTYKIKIGYEGNPGDEDNTVRNSEIKDKNGNVVKEFYAMADDWS